MFVRKLLPSRRHLFKPFDKGKAIVEMHGILARVRFDLRRPEVNIIQTS
jgi:hypothetical protein